MEPEHPEAEIFRQARTSILTFAWVGLVSIALLGLGAMTIVGICVIYLRGYGGTSDTIALYDYFAVAPTCVYGGWTFLHLLRCGRSLGAGQDIGLALEQHRLFWQHGAILSGLLLTEVAVFFGCTFAAGL